MRIRKLEEFNNIYYCDAYLREMRKVLVGYSQLKKYQKWLFEQLSILDDPDINFMDFPNRFEKIEAGMFAITYRHPEKNVRILFTIEAGCVKLLLCCFDEKKSADYDKAKASARGRIKEARDLGGKYYEQDNQK